MFWVCCRRITSFCLLITIFFESLRFFCPTIPRYSSDTHKPLSARRSPQLPPHSGLLPMRPTPNEPTLGKGERSILLEQRCFLYCVDTFLPGMDGDRTG